MTKDKDELTDEQCNEFRRLPLSFNDMIRAIYKAGMGRQRDRDIAAVAYICNSPAYSQEGIAEEIRRQK